MTERTAKPDRTWWIVGLGFVVAWVVYLAVFGPSETRELPTPGLGPVLGRPDRADFAWSVRDLNEKPATLESFRGKTVFLNVWATWCGPCVAELPAIARLAANPRLKDMDIAFVCVSTDQSAGTVRSFLRGKDWPMTVLIASDVPAPFATQGIPATFLIAPDGRIVAAEVGSAAWDDPSVVAFLENLAKPRPAAIQP